MPKPPTLDRAQVQAWLDHMSRRPDEPLFDVRGDTLPASAIDAFVANADRDAVPKQQRTRYGLTVHRAALRSFPTLERVFDERGDTDIDRFQESALFPGTPVAIVHASRDGEWLFVVSPRYAAWALIAVAGAVVAVWPTTANSPGRKIGTRPSLGSRTGSMPSNSASSGK